MRVFVRTFSLGLIDFQNFKGLFFLNADYEVKENFSKTAKSIDFKFSNDLLR